MFGIRILSEQGFYMIDEIGKLLDAHWRWLKDKTLVRSSGEEWVEITTPYLDRHNDMLQIFARRGNSGFILTDDGYVISDLLHSGCKLDSPRRQMLLNMTLGGFGVQNNDGRLEVHSTVENFASQKHAVRYTPNVKFTGKSGFDHLFEFVIPRSRQQPERILQTINRPSRDTAELNRGRMRSSMTRNTPFPQAFWMLCINTTTTRFTESTIDEANLEWADGLAYTVLYGPEFAPDEPHVEGKSLGEVLLMGVAAGEDRYRRGCKGHLTVRAPLARNAPKGGLISEGDPVVSAAHFGKDLIDSGSRQLQSIAAVAQQHLDLIAAILLHGDPVAAFRARDCQSSVGECCV